jgi:hypothetical protein
VSVSVVFMPPNVFAVLIYLFVKHVSEYSGARIEYGCCARLLKVTGSCVLNSQCFEML